MVIGDLSVLKALSAAENSVLQQEVAQKGLGLIIRADSADKKASWLQSSFTVRFQAGKQAALTALNIPGKDKTAKLNLDPDYIIPQGNTQPLITDEHGRLLTAVALNGAGKLIFTTINNTYTWMLAGNQADYTALWSLLIDKAARKLPAKESWSVASTLPTENQPVHLVSESAMPGAGVKTNQVVTYAAQNPAIPFQQQVTYWPSANGWQQTVSPNGAPYWWYVWKKHEWLSLKAAKKIAQTARYVKQNAASIAVTKQIQQKTRVPLPKIYFYMLFLMAATFLWAESKFYS